jgi:hypothetical protein
MQQDAEVLKCNNTDEIQICFILNTLQSEDISNTTAEFVSLSSGECLLEFNVAGIAEIKSKIKNKHNTLGRAFGADATKLCSLQSTQSHIIRSSLREHCCVSVIRIRRNFLFSLPKIRS